MASTVNVVSSNSCVGPSPRTKISLFLLLTCIDEFISAPKLMTFFPVLLPANESSEWESNPMGHLLYSYLSGPTFLVSFRDPNKQFFNVKFVFKFYNHGLSV